MANRRGRLRKFCPDCAKTAYRRHKPEQFDKTAVYQCRYCSAQWCNVGGRSAGRQGPKKFCSQYCARSFHYDEQKGRRAPLRNRIVGCEYCGLGFVVSHRRKVRFCSDACRYSAQGTYRSRAKFWGVEYEPINRRQVFDRDNWTCGICHNRIDSRLKYPDDLAVTLDHIIPMSEGGGHVWSNVQAAHWICNARKGVNLCGSQLLLFGFVDLPPVPRPAPRIKRVSPARPSPIIEQMSSISPDPPVKKRTPKPASVDISQLVPVTTQGPVGEWRRLSRSQEVA